MRRTQWIDWDNDKEETIGLKGEAKLNEPPWIQETTNWRLRKSQYLNSPQFPIDQVGNYPQSH
jgi:hypothetical protein